MMQKKAQSKLLVTLIACLAAGLIVILFFAVVLPAMRDTSDKLLCSVTVGAKYGSGRASMGTESSVRLACYTQTLDIRQDGIFKSGKNTNPKKLKGQPNFEKGDDDEDKIEAVQWAIANEMYDCWDQFGEGRFPIFFGRKSRCVVCSEITFQDGWLDDKSSEQIKIGPFLNEETMPMHGEMTYSEYFKGRFAEDFKVDPATRSQVVFKGVGRAWLDNWWLVGSIIVGGPLLGGAIGLVIAAKQGEEWIPVILLGPLSEVGGSCDRLF